MKKPKDKEIFDSAQSFHEAYDLMIIKSNKTPKGNLENRLIQPALICLLFALEMFFKCLIFITKNKFSHGHKPLLLFEELDQSLQSELLMFWNKLVNHPKYLKKGISREVAINRIESHVILKEFDQDAKDNFIASWMHSEASLNMTAFKERLRNLSTTYTDFRYSYEKGYMLDADLYFVNNMCKILEKKIVSIKNGTQVRL